jgi:hypothetical protein
VLRCAALRCAGITDAVVVHMGASAAGVVPWEGRAGWLGWCPGKGGPAGWGGALGRQGRLAGVVPWEGRAGWLGWCPEAGCCALHAVMNFLKAMCRGASAAGAIKWGAQRVLRLGSTAARPDARPSVWQGMAACKANPGRLTCHAKQHKPHTAFMCVLILRPSAPAAPPPTPLLLRRSATLSGDTKQRNARTSCVHVGSTKVHAIEGGKRVQPRMVELCTMEDRQGD